MQHGSVFHLHLRYLLKYPFREFPVYKGLNTVVDGVVCSSKHALIITFISIFMY